jgi:hypothetical protein
MRPGEGSAVLMAVTYESMTSDSWVIQDERIIVYRHISSRLVIRAHAIRINEIQNRQQ